MPSCINRVVLVGNLGADPDTRFTPSGTQVVTANLATDDVWTDRQGVKRQRTEWHRLVLWRRLAEIATEYLHKGSRIHVEGRLQSRSWEDDDGHRHFLTEIVVSDLKILDGPADGPAELDLSYGRESSLGEMATQDLATQDLATQDLATQDLATQDLATRHTGTSSRDASAQATLALFDGGEAYAGGEDDLPF